MKKLWSMLLVITMLCGMFVVPVGAEINMSNVEVIANSSWRDITFYRDLDCDGVEDKIHIYTLQEDSVYNLHIAVNDYDYTEDLYKLNVSDVYIADLNHTDNTVEIMIHKNYHSHSWINVYRYENGELSELMFESIDGKIIAGSIERFGIEYEYSVTVPGNGTLYITGTIGGTNPIKCTDKYQELERGVLKQFVGNPILFDDNNNYDTSDRIIVALNYYDENNSEEIQFDQPPIIQNDRTLVPMRAIFEAMGCDVEWDGDLQQVDVYKDGYNIMTLWIDEYEMWTENGYITLDVSPQILNDRTLVPVRAISESMGAKVDWDGELKLVDIHYYPPYSGTTTSDYYYKNQSDIVNFGNILSDNPYWAGEDEYCCYYYSYDENSDIDYCIEQYLDAMENEGFDVEFIKDEGGSEFYKITGFGYEIRFINDYLLEHIQVEIDIVDNSQQIIENDEFYDNIEAVVYQMASESSILKMFGEPDRKEAKRQEMYTGFYYQNWVYDDLGISFRMCSEEKDGEQYVDTCTILEQSDVKLITGIGIGSHKDEVLQTYSNSLDYGDRISFTFDGGGEIIFAVENDCVSTIYVGYIAE